ncbi:MAG: hypothetical protein Q9166_004710 [cf. Caloplaca sp. 2 TL-2023]
MYSSPFAIHTPIRNSPQASEDVDGGTEIGDVLPAVTPTNCWHGEGWHRIAQHQRKIKRKLIYDTRGKQIHPDETRNGKDDMIFKLQTEKLMIDASVLDLQNAIDKAMDLRLADTTSTELVTLQQTLQGDVTALKNHIESYKHVDPWEMEKRGQETALMKAKAARWTNNIELLEGWLDKAFGGDRHQLDSIRRECYGAEYIDGEDLKEL